MTDKTLIQCGHCGGKIKKKAGFGGMTYFLCNSCGLTASFRDMNGTGLQATNPDASWNTRHVPDGYALVPVEILEKIQESVPYYATKFELHDLIIASKRQ